MISGNVPLSELEEGLEEALADAANLGAINTAYPWPQTVIAVLDRVIEAGHVTEADTEEAFRLLDEAQVELDIEDSNAG